MANDNPQRSTLAVITFVIACGTFGLSLLMGLFAFLRGDAPAFNSLFGLLQVYGMITLFVIAPLNIIFGLVALGHLIFSRRKGLYLVLLAECITVISIVWFTWL